MKFIPLNGKILVRQYKKEDKTKTASGIIIPDSAQDENEDRLINGMIIAVASDVDIPIGADVWVEQHLVHGIRIDDTPYIVIQENDLDGWAPAD